MSVTPANIEAEIVSEVYQNSGNDLDDWTISLSKAGLGHIDLRKIEQALSLLTICVLVLRNGHTVVGESYCQNPAAFDAQTGRDEARKDAIRKLWPMMVYADRSAPAEWPEPNGKVLTDADALADLMGTPRPA